MDTSYTIINVGQLVREFGSTYPGLLVQLHQQLTRETATTYLTTKELVDVLYNERTARFQVRSTNPYEDDNLEFRLQYMGLENAPLPPPPDYRVLLNAEVAKQRASYDERAGLNQPPAD